LRLVLKDAAVDHDVTVYQPELIVYTEWHMKQLRSLQAVVGPSLALYAQVRGWACVLEIARIARALPLTDSSMCAQADLLVDLVRVMVEENELVVGYRSRTERVGPPVSANATRRHYNYVRMKPTPFAPLLSEPGIDYARSQRQRTAFRNGSRDQTRASTSKICRSPSRSDNPSLLIPRAPRYPGLCCEITNERTRGAAHSHAP
jgi:hypothetical protein